MNIVTTIAKRLRHHRERLRLSQNRLAKRASVNASVVSRLESRRQAGLDVDVLVRLARALSVTTDDLLGHVADGEQKIAGEEGEDEADEDDHRRWQNLLPGHLDVLANLSLDEQRDVLQLIDDWVRARRSAQAPGLPWPTVRLDAFFLVRRGQSVPAGWVVPDLPVGADRDLELEGAFVKAQLRVARLAHDRWGRLAKGRDGDLVPCFTTGLIQPFVPGSKRAGMIRLMDGHRVTASDATVADKPRFVVEPRSLVTMFVPAAGGRAGITQTVYSLTPRPRQVKTLRKVLVRLPAFLMSIDPGRLAPAVRWLERGYRPRVAQVAALPIPANITTDTDEWLAVDHVAADLAARVRDGNVAPPEHVEGFARPMWWRDWIKRTALPAAVAIAVGLGTEVRP